MKNIRILTLEDDLETLFFLFKKLHLLQEELEKSSLPTTFSVTVLSEYTQVEEYINNLKDFKFDVVLLDRDCKIGGSFQVLDIEKFGADNIISISSIPEYNEEAKKRGVKKVVWKDFQNLDKFTDSVIDYIKELI